MAYAIWYSIKKKRRVSANPVNFLKPYQNIVRRSDFISGLGKAFHKDTLNIVNQSNKQTQKIIKIQM